MFVTLVSAIQFSSIKFHPFEKSGASPEYTMSSDTGIMTLFTRLL